MVSQDILFELPIGGAKITGKGNTGKIVCTQPRPKIYLLTFENGPDNRLVTAFCKTLLLALDIIQLRYPAGVVLTTSAIPKFYSNGMDIEHAMFTAGYMPNTLYALWKRILTYPMPTVAVCNGHTFAGGFMLASMHDYRVMNPHKGFLCLNELELGAPLRPAMVGIFRVKFGGGEVLREMVLEAKRFKALEALEKGLIDSVGGVEEAIKFVEDFKLVEKALPGMMGVSVYGDLKREMYREEVALLEGWMEENLRDEKARVEMRREAEERKRNVEEWERVKAKL